MTSWAEIERVSIPEILEWAAGQPWAQDMAACRQDALWHAEGDVWTHTRLVVAELERLEVWDTLDHESQLKLVFTALFHDAGKPATTVVDPDTGRTRSPKHAVVGMEIGRSVQGNSAPA
jgi:putative nucleotidyltransferase with HDIG domain